MDFGSIKDKIQSQKYKTLYQVAEDVRLIWTNCMAYNADGSDFYKLAENLQKKWDDKYSKLLQDMGTSNNNNNNNTTTGGTLASSATSGGATGAATAGNGGAAGGTAAVDGTTASSLAKANIQDKKNFAKSLYQISKEDLGKVLLLVDVEAKCPAAINCKRNATEDETEFNILMNSREVSYRNWQPFVASVKGKKKKAPTASSNKRAKVTS